MVNSSYRDLPMHVPAGSLPRIARRWLYFEPQAANQP